MIYSPYTRLEIYNTMQKNSLGIPIAIVISALIIAGAIYFTGKDGGGATPQITGNTTEDLGEEPVVAPITADDHILGNPNALIMLVEYSDYDCPFCKNFHDTMRQIMSEYGPEGTVAWVYRQFPLESLHPNAPKIAAASECVAELGGNEAFWTFSDMIFDERETNAQTDITRLPEFAEKAGVDKGQFELCYNSGKYDAVIADDIQAAIAAGGRGTPHTIVLAGEQYVGEIGGAQPYATVKQNIEGLIKQLNEAQ